MTNEFQEQPVCKECDDFGMPGPDGCPACGKIDYDESYACKVCEDLGLPEGCPECGAVTGF